MKVGVRDYYLRIFSAFVLLKVASGLIKDAEKSLRTAMESKDVEPANMNGHVDIPDATPLSDLAGDNGVTPEDEEVLAAELPEGYGDDE